MLQEEEEFRDELKESLEPFKLLLLIKLLALLLLLFVLIAVAV